MAIERPSVKKANNSAKIIILSCLITVILLSGINYYLQYRYFQSPQLTPSTNISNPSEAQEFLAPLHTKGTEIRNAHDDPIVLYAANVSFAQLTEPRRKNRFWNMPQPDSNLNDKADMSQGSIYDLLQKQGFNTVRLSLHWQNIEPLAPDATGHHYDDQYFLSDVDYIIRQLTLKNIGVIINFHQSYWSPAFTYRSAQGACVKGTGAPAWLYPNACVKSSSGTCTTIKEAKYAFFNSKDQSQESFIAMVQHVAKHFATQKNLLVVGYDLFNEPNYKDYPNCDGSMRPTSETQYPSVDVSPFYEKVGKVIQDTYTTEQLPQPLYFFQVSNTKDTFVSKVPTLPNPVYTFHLYPRTSQDAVTVVKKHIANSKQMNIPLWISEWTQNLNPDSTQTGKQDMYMVFDQYLKPNKVSWAYWLGAPGWKYSINRVIKGKVVINTDMVSFLKNHAMYTYE